MAASRPTPDALSGATDRASAEQPQLLKVVVVAPQGRRSVVYGATFLRRAYLSRFALRQPKLAFVLYDGIRQRARYRARREV
jgi:hypothetical protein